VKLSIAGLQDFFQRVFNNVDEVMVNKLLECSQVEQSIGIKSGLFGGQFSGSTNPGTKRISQLFVMNDELVHHLDQR